MAADYGEPMISIVDGVATTSYAHDRYLPEFSQCPEDEFGKCSLQQVLSMFDRTEIPFGIDRTVLSCKASVFGTCAVSAAIAKHPEFKEQLDA